MAGKFSVILIGAGDRGMIYARQSLKEDARFYIAGVVEPDRSRLKRAGEAFTLPEDRLFPSIDELLVLPKIADAVFNCTMDQAHVETTIPLLNKGYDMLLEKPIATSWDGTKEILTCAEETKRIVTICHVLRYAPFYRRMKELIEAKTIGDVINIQMSEQVSYFHESVSYVRGKFADPKICGSGLLLSKCVHDLDVMAWLLDSGFPKHIYSHGSVFTFRPEMAPEGAADRCMNGCSYMDTCPYSAKTLYVDHPQRWANRVWNDCHLANGTREEKIASLSDPQNSYGKCVYQTNLKIVDHQSVLMEFGSGLLATFSVTGGAAAPSRKIHIIGTKGEIEGKFEESCFELRLISPEAPNGYISQHLDVSKEQHGDAHGGGDELILQDFFALLDGNTPSICCSTLQNSVISHQIVYAAEKFREEH